MSDRGTRTYLVLSGVLILAGLVVASVLLAGRDFRDHGPLSPPGSTLRQDPVVEQVLSNCHDADNDSSEAFNQVVTAIVDGRRLHACYTAEPTPGGYPDVIVIDESARQVDDPGVLKAAGAWPWRGIIVRAEHLLFGVVAEAALCLLGLLYYRAPLRGPALRSGPRGVDRCKRSWARRAKIAGRFAFVFVALQIGTLSWYAVRVQDVWGMATVSFLVAGFILATVGGWFWLIHPDFDRPDEPGAAGRSRQRGTPSLPVNPHVGGGSPCPPLSPPGSRYEVDAAALRRFRAHAKTRAAWSKLLRSAVIFLTTTVFVILLALSVYMVLPVQSILSLVVFLIFFLTVAVLWALFTQFTGIAMALLALPLILGWRDPARILLLRPFNRADYSRPLRRLARREAAGYGHVYSLADVAINVRWYVAFPVLLGQLGLMSFRLRRLRHLTDVESLGHRVNQIRRRNLNWVVAYSKVFPVRCVDEVWRQSVTKLVFLCDVVLMDVTDVTENMIWEIESIAAASRTEDCIFLALIGTEHRAAANVSSLLRRPIEVFAFDQAGRLAAPRQFRDRLADIVFRRTGSRAPDRTLRDR